MKILFIFFIVITCLIGGYSISSANENEDSKEIVKLLKAVYKENNQKFLKFDNKEKRETILKYYKRYFTDEMSATLTQYVEDSKKTHNSHSQGAFGRDPRYGDYIDTGDPDDPWLLDEYRTVKSIKFLPPKISGDKAVANVDSLIESKDILYRSEYHLIKTPNGWKIDNIIWGPQEAFYEPINQGLFQLK